MWLFKPPRLFNGTSTLNGRNIISPYEVNNLFIYLNKSIISVLSYNNKRALMSSDDQQYILYRLLDNSLFFDVETDYGIITDIVKQTKSVQLFKHGITDGINPPHYRYTKTTYIDMVIRDNTFIKVLHTDKIDFAVNIDNFENDIIGIDYDKFIMVFMKYVKIRIDTAESFDTEISRREIIIDFLNTIVNEQLVRSYMSFSILNYLTSDDKNIELFKSKHDTWFYHSDRILKDVYEIYNDTFNKQPVTYIQILKTIPASDDTFMDNYFNIDFHNVTSKNVYIVFYILAVLNLKLSKFNIRDDSVYRKDLDTLTSYYKNGIKGIKEFPLEKIQYKELLNKIKGIT